MRHVNRSRTAADPAAPFSAVGVQAVIPALLAALLGAFILFGVALAGSQTLHSAAHDARHAFAFPCH